MQKSKQLFDFQDKVWNAAKCQWTYITFPWLSRFSKDVFKWNCKKSQVNVTVRTGEPNYVFR
jgi:hypothetical protein